MKAVWQEMIHRATAHPALDCEDEDAVVLPSMKPSGSATTFHVSNLEASLAYYTDMLGFSQRFRFGDYAGVEYGSIQIHLSGPDSTNKREIGQAGLYIFCDDVDAYYSDVVSKGAMTQSPPRNYEYGMRDFVIEDPDANLITIGQEIKND